MVGLACQCADDEVVIRITGMQFVIPYLATSKTENSLSSPSIHRLSLQDFHAESQFRSTLVRSLLWTIFDPFLICVLEFQDVFSARFEDFRRSFQFDHCPRSDQTRWCLNQLLIHMWLVFWWKGRRKSFFYKSWMAFLCVLWMSLSRQSRLCNWCYGSFRGSACMTWSQSWKDMLNH